MTTALRRSAAWPGAAAARIHSHVSSAGAAARRPREGRAALPLSADLASTAGAQAEGRAINARDLAVGDPPMFGNRFANDPRGTPGVDAIDGPGGGPIAGETCVFDLCGAASEVGTLPQPLPAPDDPDGLLPLADDDGGPGALEGRIVFEAAVEGAPSLEAAGFENAVGTREMTAALA